MQSLPLRPLGRLAALLLVPALAWASDPASPPVAAASAPAAPAPQKPTIWLVGDSTVKVSTAGQVGWGECFAPYVDPARAKVENRAIGGRSTRTFLAEGRWEAIRGELRGGDLVIIQFGHNDASPVNDDRRARGTLPGVGEESVDIVNQVTGKEETVTTYGAYLRRYVREAKAAGASVVLCSPVPRNNWEGGRVKRIASTYGDWAATVAYEEGARFVPLNELIALEYEQRGPAEVDLLFGGDHTHTNQAGAELNALCVVQGLLALFDPAIDALFSARTLDKVQPVQIVIVPAEPESPSAPASPPSAP